MKAVLLTLLLFGCASEPLTEQEKYERANRRVLAHEAFERMQEQCRSGGGIVVVDRDRASCVRDIGDIF